MADYYNLDHGSASGYGTVETTTEEAPRGRGSGVPRGRGGIPRVAGSGARWRGSDTASPQLAQDLQFTKVDISPLLTEEEIQREKLREAREVQEGIQDIHETYMEFSALVDRQQAGLDTASQNIGAACNNVVKGTEELRSASKHQVCGRKLILTAVCIALIIVVVVIALLAVMR